MLTKSPLSWREIESRALEFATSWKNASSENADSQTFWNEFFTVFGVPRRRVALFETKVKKLSGHPGFIDLFWPKMLIVEHKTRGENLNKAFKQVTDYLHNISNDELPRYIIVSDFNLIKLRDLENGNEHEISLKDLHRHVRLFGFIAGYETSSESLQEDPINQKAAEALGRLHDQFEQSGYLGHKLELFLVRILYCLFAQSTRIFDHGLFQKLIRNTREDGADTGARILQLFETLNIQEENRYKNLDDELVKFQYINGNLFKEPLPTPSFNKKMRQELLECCALDWANISPAIFGTLFQSIMNKESRRSLGAHYTSEKNILRVIRPLFLDDLLEEFSKIKNNRRKVEVFHEKLQTLTFLDPACGCGNFLIIAYRELRKLELEVLRALKEAKDQYFDIQFLIRVDVNQFYGIELEEFPAQIAQVAMWLTDHQMNQKVSEEFGKYFARIPLRTSPHIVQKNALRCDWNEVISAGKLSFILGNPPFKGPHHMTLDQQEDTKIVFRDIKGGGILDYVAAWYVKATDYLLIGKAMDNIRLRCALVSTNSIVQGEQVAVLWEFLLSKGIHIQFAHRTFQWNNEARGVSAVHCVIIGFGLERLKKLVLFEYPDLKGEPHSLVANHINPYLTDAPDILVKARTKAVCLSPSIRRGCKPIDDGNYAFTAKEKDEFLKKEPLALPYFHRWIGAEEFINNIERWCLWLGDCPAHILRKMPEALKRVQAVKEFRLRSKSGPTLKIANTPTQFHVTIIPKLPFLVIPGVSSERRQYIPLGFMSPDVMVGDKCLIIQDATLYHFAILSSSMHMAWIRAVAGRMKSDYSYSGKVVYNNFPWPDLQASHENKVIVLAEQLINIRVSYSKSSLADLYDPLTMPQDLLKAHLALDRAVDAAYGAKGVENEAERISFLFQKYANLTKVK